MKSVPFTFPYFPQAIQFAVLILVLCVFALLYITIGIVSQIAGVFHGLILDAQKQMKEGSAIERSAQGCQHRNLLDLAIPVLAYSVAILLHWSPLGLLSCRFCLSRVVGSGSLLQQAILAPDISGITHVAVTALVLTMRSSQPLAGAMCTFDFMKRFSEFAMLASASGG